MAPGTENVLQRKLRLTEFIGNGDREPFLIETEEVFVLPFFVVKGASVQAFGYSGFTGQSKGPGVPAARMSDLLVAVAFCTGLNSDEFGCRDRDWNRCLCRSARTPDRPGDRRTHDGGKGKASDETRESATRQVNTLLGFGERSKRLETLAFQVQLLSFEYRTTPVSSTVKIF